MNYRHIYHAGNHADVMKHATLICVLEALKRKPAAFGVLETHAGVGIYDLEANEASRSPEWQNGIGRLWESDAPALAPLLELVRLANLNDNLQKYPGSPEVARALLRAQDRYIGCELHPQDATTLKALYGRDPRMQIHTRDGWGALTALLPLPERRGLVLIDPPYEQLGELGRAAKAVGAAHLRFPQGVIAWWRPLKDAAALDRADAEALAQGAPGLLRLDLWIDTPTPVGPMLGSSMAFVRPPFGLREALEELGAALCPILAIGTGAGYRVVSLGML
jgi:23S rRNA (adenine2030-N6)-methyltransferase